MKTKLLVLIVVLFSASAIAQTVEENVSFRPGKGNISIELDFLPFSDDGPINLRNFRSKYSISEKFALRAGFDFDHKSITDENPFVYNDDDNQIMKFDKYDMNYTLWGITAGMEYHFFANTRVSPYVGLEFGFESKSSEYNSELNYLDYNYPGYTSYVVEKEIENGWNELELIINQWGDQYFVQSVSERGFTAFEANIFAGADIYFLKHFYAGTELGLGYKAHKYKEVSIKEDGVLSLKYPEKKENTFGLLFNNAIRIGFWF